MSEAHARAWWADVEHLREAAERRSSERAKARIEGRDAVALTPLRALHAVDGLAAFDEALDAVQPVAPGETRRSRRFAREGGDVHELRASTLTVVIGDDHDKSGEEPVRRRPRIAGPSRRPAAVPANSADPSRRTVEIRGTVVPMPVALVPDQANDVGPARRRPSRTVGERVVGSPDRIAAYAVLLGVFLILVALLSTH